MTLDIRQADRRSDRSRPPSGRDFGAVVTVLPPDIGFVLNRAMRKPVRPRFDRSSTTRSANFVLGRDHFAQISAVEGIALTQEMRTILDRFDRDGLSAEERRRAILIRYAPAR